MYSLKEKLGARIQEIRKSKNLTQERLAEAIDLDTPNLSNIERGKRFLSADTLEKIARALEVNPKDLFDFGHILPKKEIIKNINSLLDKASDKDLRYYYKVILAHLENKI